MKLITTLFTYGTLSHPAVMTLVAGRTFETEPAQLDGYARYRARDKLFPGIVAEHASSVPGVVHKNVDHESMKRIDFFEDAFYQRQQLRVRLETGEEKLANTFVIPNEKRSVLTAEPWSNERFEKDHLENYLQRVRDWMKDFPEG